MGKKRHKNTILEEAEMVKLVYAMMMRGKSNYKIIDELMELHGVNSEGNAKRLIDKVNQLIKVNVEKDLELVKEKYLEMFTDLYEKCLTENDMRAANDVLKSLTKLRGLDVQKIETKIEGNTNINLTNVTDEKLDELINKLIDNNKIDG